MPPGRRDSKADGACIPFKLSMMLRIAQDKSVVCNGTRKVHASSCTDTSAVSSLLEATERANNARIHIAAVIIRYSKAQRLTGAGASAVHGNTLRGGGSPVQLPRSPELSPATLSIRPETTPHNPTLPGLIALRTSQESSMHNAQAAEMWLSI